MVKEISMPRTPWFGGFYTKVHEAIKSLGFVPEVDGPMPSEILVPHFKTRTYIPSRAYRGEMRGDLLPVVCFGGGKGPRGFEFDVVTTISCPPVVGILAALQGTPNVDKLIHFQMINHFLSVDGRTAVTKHDDQDEIVSAIVNVLKVYAIPWFESFDDFRQLWSGLNYGKHCQVLQIAANLYLGDFESALDVSEQIRAWCAQSCDTVMEQDPTKSRAEAEKMVFSKCSDDLPNPDFRRPELFELVRKACDARTVDVIFSDN